MTTTMTTKALHDEIIRKVSNGNYADGTYDIETLKAVSFSKGFQVSFCEIGMNYSDEQYDFIVDMFREFSMDGKTYLGFFDGCAEISFRIADKKTARRLAKQFNQICVWNWKKCKCLNTNGTGRKA